MKYRYIRSVVSLIFSLLLIVGAIMPAFAESLEQEDTTLDIVVGSPKQDMEEGRYQNIYWQAKICGTGALCWIKLSCGVNATTIKTSLTVQRGKFGLGPWNYYTLENTDNNSNFVSTTWAQSDYVIINARGRAYINGVQVSNMYIGGLT